MRGLDGDPTTRWSSGEPYNGQTEWLAVDLGRVVSVDRARLVWEAAYASKYAVQATNATAGLGAPDAEWSTVGLSPAKGGAGGIEVVPLVANTSARFFRVHCLERFAGSQWGFSLYEFQLYAPHLQ